MTTTPQLQLLLNANGVAAPLQKAVAVSSQVVAITLDALGNSNLKEKVLKGPVFGFQFSGVGVCDGDLRQIYRSWILGKGFQELVRGVRETLEEAAFFIAVARMSGFNATLASFRENLESIRKQYSKLSFPQLMSAVNSGLIQPMTFNDEFLSLQRIRNCLEHRAGCVGPADINDASGTMTLTFPRLRFFYKRGGEEVEVALGEIIDTEDIDDNGDVQIYCRRVTSSREYALGDQIALTEADFGEIATACLLFTNDLVSKLPRLPKIDSGLDQSAD